MFRAGQKPDGLVFPSANQTPLRNRNFRRDVFDDAVDALKLDITPHNLRDTAASLAIQAGASVVAVARLLGHESAATTLNHYAGLFPSDLDDVALRLDLAARAVLQEQDPGMQDNSDSRNAAVKRAARRNTAASAALENRVVPEGHVRSAAVERYLADIQIRARDDQSALPSTTEAPTTHRPEGSDEE